MPFRYHFATKLGAGRHVPTALCKTWSHLAIDSELHHSSRFSYYALLVPTALEQAEQSTFHDLYPTRNASRDAED